MARPLRILYENAWYHVMNRGRHGEKIFQNPEGYQTFIDLLKETSRMWDLRVAAYCLMGNHYHLLMQTPQANLPRCMRHINGVYTQKYNRMHNKDSQLFRGRYKAVLVDADSYLLELLRYIHRNPLRAGMVSRIDDYAWSSHHCYLSSKGEYNWLYKDCILSMLDLKKDRQRNAYRIFITEQDSEQITEFFSRKHMPAILGKDKFIDRIRQKYFKLLSSSEVPELRTLSPDISMVKQAVCSIYGVEPESLLVSRRGITNEARNMAVYLARQYTGNKLEYIADEFNINSYSTVSSILSSVKVELQKNRDLRKRAGEAEKIFLNSQRKI